MNKQIELKINFTDFWPGFNKTDNFFYNLLIEKYKVVIADKPDFLFYSAHSNDHTRYKCTKIFFTGENVRPNFIQCDFAFSFDYSDNPKNYRLPLYALYHDVTKLISRDIDAGAVLKSKTKFCCFLISNAGCEIRNDFFKTLSKYKKVDSGGRVFNNIGYQVENKWEFIKDYKFVIAFENASFPGYTTEKIYEPFIKNCVPIYWGNPLVINDFNTGSFINCHDYQSFDEVIKHIITVDNDDRLYLQYIAQPVFNNDTLNGFVKKENIVARLDDIVAFHYNGRFKIYAKIRPAYFIISAAYKNLAVKIKSLTIIPGRLLKRAGSPFKK